MTLTICGARAGHWGRLYRVDGPRGIKRWVNGEERQVSPPVTLRCEHPDHAWRVSARRWRWPRGECFCQRWQLTRSEVHRAFKDCDLFTLSIGPRIVCPDVRGGDRRLNMMQTDGPVIPSREWLEANLRLCLEKWERDGRIRLSLPGGNPFRFASSQAEMNTAWDKSVAGRGAVREALAAEAADHLIGNAAQMALGES